MLNLPVYLRGNSYYLHTRIFGIQVKRSLRTGDRKIAMIRALEIMKVLSMANDYDLSKMRKAYTIDLERGQLHADSLEDHNNLMEALALMKSMQSQKQPLPLEKAVGEPASTKYGLTLVQLLDRYFLLKTAKPATVLAHKNTVKEFEQFFKEKCYINNILLSDITRYQEYLATKGNVPRTIDSKVGYLKALLNFAIKQGYLHSAKNPAENMGLLSKKQKLAGGYLIFEEEEIKSLFTCEYFQAQKLEDPDYYYVLILGLLTGCRISELTSLKKSQISVGDNDFYIITIRDSKTLAGRREVTIPKSSLGDGFDSFLDSKSENIFRYAPIEGKGSGNAVGKKFSRHLKLLKINRGKLVFHSIRKFANDFFMKNGVEYEPRCQFFGHEIESVNVATYSNKFSASQLNELVKPSQFKLRMMAGLIKTDFLKLMK